MTMPSDEAMTEAWPVRRMEVLTGAGHRRTWPPEAKSRVVAKSYSGLETVCAVALAPTQLFSWRREARARALSPAEPQFAPVVVGRSAALRQSPKAPRGQRRRGSGAIELEIDGVTVRVGRGADAETVAAIIRALKDAR